MKINKQKFFGYSMYPLVAGQLVVGCILLTGLSVIVQHSSGDLCEKIAKFCSREPENFIRKMKETTHNLPLLYKNIFFDLLESYRKSLA